MTTLIVSSRRPIQRGALVVLGVCALALLAQRVVAEPATKARSETDQKRRAQAAATFAGGQVTLGELEDTIEQQNAFMRRRYQQPAGLKELLERSLRFAIMSGEAERRGYGKDSSVQEAVKQNAVQQFMKAEIDDKLPESAVPKPEIEQYYKDHLSEYVQPATQRAGLVVSATEDEAKALIVQAKDMDLRAFRELARTKSVDEASKGRGGDLGYFDAQGVVRGEAGAAVAAPVVKAAFALKTIGDVAPRPVKLPSGFGVIKLTGQRPALSRTLADVQDAIRVRLWRDRRQQAVEQLLVTLRASYKPEVHPELLDAIKLEQEPAGVPPAQPRPP
ncbi:MAG: peptidylprolyl isomerase, partial [Polyangiales bacterium]